MSPGRNSVMRQFRKYRRDLFIVAGFFLLPLLLFGEVTLGGRTMLPVDNLFQWAPWSAVAAELGVEIPQNALIGDLIIQNYAWKHFILNSLRGGELPLWNPYLFAGAPFLAAGQHFAYYPFSLVFLALPLAQAYGWYTVSQLWLAGVLLYVFGRVLGLRRAAAALAGLIYQGCGFMVVSAAVFPMIIGAAAWLPLLLACIEKIVTTAGSHTEQRAAAFPWVTLGAMALGLQTLAGHIEFTIYTLLVMAAYAAWRLLPHALQTIRTTYHTSPPITHHVSRITHHAPMEHRPRTDGTSATPHVTRPVAWLLALVLLGLMLGAVQLIPLYEVGQTNFRQDATTLAQVRDYAFPPRRILTLALPNFFGNPTHHGYVDIFSGQTIPFTINLNGEPNPHGAYTSNWGFKNYVEGAIYLGILPLFLAILAVFSALGRPPVADHPSPVAEPALSTLSDSRRAAGHRSHIIFFIVLALFSLALIFGTPLYALLYYGLPFVNQLHTPFRWVFPLSICVAVLAGFGADYLRRLEVRDWRLKASRHSLISTFKSPFPLAAVAFGSGILLLVGLFASRAFYGVLEPMIERLFMGLALAADAFPNTRAFYSYELRQLLVLGIMLVATGVVLWLSRAGRGRRPLWPFLAAAVIMLDLYLAHGTFNAAVDPALLDYKPALVQWLQAQKTDSPWRLTTFTPQGDKPLNANTGWLFDLQDIRGYDSLIPRQYTAYMATIEPQNELSFNRVQPIVRWQSLNSPLLDVLGVKYIITAETIDLPKLQLAWEGEGLRVYENLAVAPRAYTLPRTATAVVADALVAMTELDPRNYVIVETGDWQSEIISPISPLPSPLSNPQSPISNSYQGAEIVSYSNLEVVARANVVEPSWLVLNDSYFPGWKAFVRPVASGEEDEQEVTVTRVNGNFRGVMLEPDEESSELLVRFRYSPSSFWLGGLTSFMGAVILLFAAVIWGWRRYYRPGGTLTNTRSIAKNSLAPMALSLFNKAIDFVFAMFYLRLLGPADAGSFATAIATAGIFEIIANFGLDILLIREVSQERSRAPHFLLNTTILRLGAAAIATLPIIILVLGTGLISNPLSAAEIIAIALIMIGMVFSGMSKGITGLFYVYEEAETPAAMTTITTILKVVLGVVVLLLGTGFVGLAAVSIAVNVITLAILAALAFRRFDLAGPWRLDWDLQRRMVRLGYPLMLIHLLQTVFISIDVVLLRLMLTNGEEVAGWYSSAYKWFNALQIVPSFFTLALFPIISREIKHSLDAARRMYQMSLKLMLLLALPVAAVTSLMAYPLVDLLAGDQFLPHGAIALQIVIWSIPIGWLNSVTNYVLIALGLERMQPRAFALAVGFNIVANLLFIPAFTYVTAAVTTILSEVMLLIVFDYYLRQRLPGLSWPRFTWRPLLATAAMLVAMWLGSQIHLAAGLALGLGAYVTGLGLLRVFGDEERRILHAILPAPLTARIRLVDDEF